MFELFVGYVQPYQTLVAVLISWLGVFVVWKRSRRNWARKKFIRQVNFSLNIVEADCLLLRTLREAPAREVWLNDYGARQVIAAARRTTLDKPFLSFRSAEDMGFVHRAAVNAISEQFAGGFVMQACGAPVRRERFLIGVSYEQYADIRTRKLRVMLISESTLQAWFVPGAANRPHDLAVASPTHTDRIATLLEMGRLYTSKDERERATLCSVEIAVPLQGLVP